MGSVTVRSGRLYLDFYYRGRRCREATSLHDTPRNRGRVARTLRQIEAEIALHLFDYGKYFPGSPRLAEFRQHAARLAEAQSATPRFADFAAQWYTEKKVEWRETNREYHRAIIDSHLNPAFGTKPVDAITKSEVLLFRSRLADRPGKRGRTLGASRINKVMGTLKMILDEAAERFDFRSPHRNIKPLKDKRHEVLPFSLEEVQRLLDTVQPGYRSYLAVRFFTGLRTGEVNGLQWQDIDLARGVLHISRSLSKGRVSLPKNEGSRRTVQLPRLARQALEEQSALTGGQPAGFVFRSPDGLPVDDGNFRKRVWIPLLKHLGLEVRSPYQTRHTAASLWLASGESPEWIARQMGHTTTEMLFRVYSRYIPNLTRQDGTAFDALLDRHVGRPTQTPTAR